VCVRACTRVHGYVCVRVRACVHGWMCVCVRVCVRVCVCVSHSVARVPALQQQAESVGSPLVVLQALTQTSIIILHQTPVQNHLQLAWGARARTHTQYKYKYTHKYMYKYTHTHSMQI